MSSETISDISFWIISIAISFYLFSISLVCWLYFIRWWCGWEIATIKITLNETLGKLWGLTPLEFWKEVTRKERKMKLKSEVLELQIIVDRWTQGLEEQPFEHKLVRGLLLANACVDDLLRVQRGEQPLVPLESYPLK